MKILMPEHTFEDAEVGDRFLNTSWTICDTPYRENGYRYVPVQCDCGEKQRGRWDRLHTKDVNFAPWSTRCRKCSAGGKPRALPTQWRNRAKSADEKPQNHINDLTGMQIGDLYVLRYAGTDKRSHVLYECQCSCGNTEIIADDRLKGYRQCCSKCLQNISNGEKWIKNALTKLKIHYKPQYIFPDLIGDKSFLRFDFALLNKDNQPYTLIEFQGQQHYKPVSIFGGQEQFEKQQRYDQKKRDYCAERGIKLIEIPYDKYHI